MSNITQVFSPMTLQDPSRVARRSLVMAAVVCRGSIEDGTGQPEADALYTRTLDWLTRMHLWDAVEAGEAKILTAPIGQLEHEDLLRATWCVEGLAILEWALQQDTIPIHDQQVDPYAVADAVWFLSDDAEELIHTARLRTSTELEACRELMYAIHVRLRNFIRHRGTKNFSNWVERSWIDTLGIDEAHLIVDMDLAIDGQAISKVDEFRVQECSSLTFERHKAIIWLVEGYPSYSLTPVDT